MSQFDRCGGKLLPLNACVPFRGAVFTPQTDYDSFAHKRVLTLTQCHLIAELVLTYALVPYGGGFSRWRPE